MRRIIAIIIAVLTISTIHARSSGIRDAIKITNYTSSITTVTVTMANPIKAKRGKEPVITKEYILNPHSSIEDEGPDFGSYPDIKVTGGTYEWDDQDLIISIGDKRGFLLSVFEFDGWYYLTFEDYSRIKTRDKDLIRKYLED